MAETSTSALTRGTSGSLRYAAGAVTGLGVGVLLVSLLAFAGAIPTGTVAGVPLLDLLAVVLGAGALGMIGVGTASSAGLLDTTPDHTAGTSIAAVFGVLGFVAGSLVAAQTLGLATLWPLGGIAGAALGVGLALVPREDVALAATGGGFALITSLVVLTGVIGSNWSWQPSGLSVVFSADTTVPLLFGVAGLLLAWVGAQAIAGFGTQGKARGASLLVSANAAGMIALLVVLVSFIAVRGWGPMTEGIRYGLFWEPLTWFQVPIWNQWVIVDAPTIWFYWPFAMEGVAITNPVNGVAPAIVGTVWLVVGAVTFAVPLGVGTAVFLTEYAEQGRITALVEIATNGLWSTPSVVYGLFGLAFLVPRIGNQSTLLSGMIVLGFMLLPLVVITSREALLNVPDEYRDASAALGVSRWETIKTIVLPAAMPGVITGTILGVGRIAGETAPILLVLTGEPFPAEGPDLLDFSAGFTSSFPFVEVSAINPDALLQSATALPYQLFATITAGVGDVSEGFRWGTALVLLLVVMSFYAVGIASRIYFRRKLDA
ncbi:MULTISPECIES: phosphate ABC transporter permease PstA [Halococcus]|uniref:Phosphate transport system permease protein PstA n=1 Tax=Halococcus salifodinae DSM 8989 TaxID=1227456 RepID=M0NFS1_9EURY|nr:MULTISPECIES: phosphate ABC transporter permease PstA [Halococcus]EMA55944.1 phosphate ABC transporter permease [Halococcus salifodinae DSM 8989]